MSISLRTLVRAALICLAAGCGSAPTVDAGPPPPSGEDAGMDDGGPPRSDAGPPDLGPPEDTAFGRQMAAWERFTESECTCEPGGFRSVSACVSFALDPLLDACQYEAYATHFEAIGAVYECRAPAFEALADCAEAAGCDDAARNACADTAEAALTACPSPPDAARAAALATQNACVQRTVVGPPGTCPDSPDVVSTLGDEVFRGTTMLAGDDLEAPAGCRDTEGGASPDRAFRWAAPHDGTFAFTTFGSSFNTLIYVLDGCEGASLGCNDNPAVGELRSWTNVALTEGQEVVVVVEGVKPTDAGEFRVNITEIRP